MADINYKRMIKNLYNSKPGTLPLHPKAITYLADVLYVFNDKLARGFRDECKSKGKKGIDTDVADSALRKLFPEELYQSTVATEGDRALREFEQGLIVYKDRSAEKDQREKAEKLAQAGPFFHGVQWLLKTMDPLKFDNKFKVDISEVLVFLCAKLASTIAEKASEKNVATILDAKNAIDDVFGAQLAQHANSEGVRYVFLYEVGHIEIPPEKESVIMQKKVRAAPKPIHFHVDKMMQTMGGTMDKHAADQLTLLLSEFAKHLAKEVHSRVQEGARIEHNSVVDAIHGIMSKVMAEHAISEAYKAVALANMR